ncbi:oxygenase MpaB family protein [Pararobbsia alpina]|uniref:oxygenase MpaB family protein n=1 Tax=Pararobbsia alpina TaxID=621374 RepID=UPI0039A6B24B
MVKEYVRKQIEGQVLGISMPARAPLKLDFLNPPGDRGLFGPGAACWEVHGDFSSMLIGGMSALLLQMLDPLALAGVLDYSNFRADMLGRLRRTAQFIAGTTFGSTYDAERLIERVKAIHLEVKGETKDGRAYSATDPELLTWVHVAEVHSFLQSHLRYKNPHLSPARQDQYFDEYALIAERLGAAHVPRSRSAIERYLDERRGLLRCDARTLEVFDIVMDAPSPGTSSRWFTWLVKRAAVDLLPPWALELFGREPLRPAVSAALHTTTRLSVKPIRWAVRNSASALAHRRVQADPVRSPSPTHQ